jgi:WhiB family redox-sensing transcriptional regulator
VSFLERPDWQAFAACRTADVDLDAFFPGRGDRTDEARAICATCTVRDECLEYAMENGIQHGIWGGKSERERRKMRRQQRIDSGAGQRGPMPLGCGTRAGAGRHRQHGEPVCEECREAEAQYHRERRRGGVAA